MQINGTLFIQAINFFIAYLLLRFFLFKPAVALIQGERAEVNAFLERISNHQKALEARSREKAEKWRYYQTEFLQRVPFVGREEIHVFKKIAPALYEPPIEEHELVRLERDLIKKLIQKVDNSGN